MTLHEQNMYTLAENLGITVSALMREMSLREYMGWMQYYADRETQTRKDTKPKPAPRSSTGDVVMKGFNL